MHVDSPWLPPSKSGKAVAPLIDHTLLKPDAGQAQVRTFCREAIFYGFAAVCVNPCNLTEAVAALRQSPVKPCTVIGFPTGADTTAAKAFAAEEAVTLGALELDMVICIGALKDKRFTHVLEDIRAVVRAAGGKTVKAILETCLLNSEEKVAACQLALEAGAQFVKTSTGTAGGATAADVRLLRATVGARMGVKASGGIHTLAQAQAMLKAGANRIGTSSGVAIVTGAG